MKTYQSAVKGLLVIGAVLVASSSHAGHHEGAKDKAKMMEGKVDAMGAEVDAMGDKAKALGDDAKAMEVMKDEAKVEAPEQDIIDVALAAGSFNTLAAALTEAGLVDTLKGEGPFTVFAPTDAAFAKIPEADLNAILADKEKLTEILTYHVVAGKVMAADVSQLTAATTLQGTDVSVSAEDGVKINDATVTAADVEASNGVIHVIDTVLLPK